MPRTGCAPRRSIGAAKRAVVDRDVALRKSEAIEHHTSRLAGAAGLRDLLRLEEQLADALAAAVEIRVQRMTRQGEQGDIAISFGSLDELNGLLDKLGVVER